MADRWQAPPQRPRLAEREVHVWRAELARGAGDAHGILRALLGRYLDSDPGALELAAGAHGKPEIAGSPLRFNLSHSGRLALYAFALRAEVGVDVEVAVAGRKRDEVALAARALGPAEAKRLRALKPALREREFLRAWARHEALLKCRGTGFAGAKAAGADAAGADSGGLWLSELDVGAGAAAALACDATPERVALFDWDDDDDGTRSGRPTPADGSPARPSPSRPRAAA